MRDFTHIVRTRGLTVAGVLSGTSADGIDVALTRFCALASAAVASPGALAEVEVALGPPELLAFETLPFEAALAARLRAVLDGARTGLRETALLDRDLGFAFGAAAAALARRHELELDLVGSHGQTVWHHDGAEPSGPATLQLGDGDAVAERAGCAVASDFRRRDVAAGGEGAPLSALADPLLFTRVPRPAAVLNLGGLANLTILAERPSDRLAFDTGPANSLLDGLARRRLGADCDRDGACAARGRADPHLVQDLLCDPFFERAPPKSTGRDSFGAAWVESVIAAAAARGVTRDEDLFASAVELVARSVAQALERFVALDLEVLVLAGGGIHNRALVAALERAVRSRVVSSEIYGVPPDAREALVFAVLGVRCALGIASSDPTVTGARAGRVLGKLSR